MRIHSDRIAPADIVRALADLPGVTLHSFSEHGSRKRDHAIEFTLHGNSPYQTMGRTGNAATWDEWGVLMSRLFNLDSDAILGREDRADFEYRTGDRFDDMVLPDDTHARHDWYYSGPGHACKKCSAIQHWNR